MKTLLRWMASNPNRSVGWLMIGFVVISVPISYLLGFASTTGWISILSQLAILFSGIPAVMIGKVADKDVPNK